MKEVEFFFRKKGGYSRAEFGFVGHVPAVTNFVGADSASARDIS